MVINFATSIKTQKKLNIDLLNIVFYINKYQNILIIDMFISLVIFIVSPIMDF